jgi:tyrosyl-tRNA synthetase
VQFGKLMSISDELMWRYFELLSFRPLAQIAGLRQSVADGRNPRDVKFELGVELVERFHGEGAGARARDAFVARFQQGQVPEHIEKVSLTTDGSAQRLANVLKNAGLVSSTSDGNRMIDQGAVRVGAGADSLAKVAERDRSLTAGTYLIQVGKHKYRWVTLAGG